MTDTTLWLEKRPGNGSEESTIHAIRVLRSRTVVSYTSKDLGKMRPDSLFCSRSTGVAPFVFMETSYVLCDSAALALTQIPSTSTFVNLSSSLEVSTSLSTLFTFLHQ